MGYRGRRTRELLVQMIEQTVGSPRYGVEIGVCEGETSQFLLDRFPDLALLMVDPWKEWPEGSSYYDHRRLGKMKQVEWDQMYQRVLKRFSDRRYKGRVNIVRETSFVVSQRTPGYSLDFVYIDGDHTDEPFRLDIASWYPAIRPGGLVCGHDYGGRCHGVKRVADEFFGIENLMLPGETLWGYHKPCPEQ